MRKLFVDKIDGDEVIITGEDHRHLAYSLRAKRGDEIVLCSDNVEYTAIITTIDKTSLIAKISGKTHNASELDTDITLFFGALKGDKNDYVVQKCTELGVKEFCPFVSEFCVATKDSIKAERLNRIALESAKQSGRGQVPKVAAACEFNDLLDSLPGYDLVVFPYEHEETQTLADIITDKTVRRVAVVVGSEGGFSRGEAEQLRKISHSITLGERILRADTASVAVVSAIAFGLGEWRRRR